MVALVVFLVGSFAAFSYYATSRITLNLEGHRRTAAEIAQSRVEELRTVAYENLLSYQEEGTEISVDGIAGTRDTAIQDIDEDEDTFADYSKVTVTVTWPEKSRDQEVALVTFHSSYR